MTYVIELIVYNIKYKICINMYKYLGGLFRAGPTDFLRAGPFGLFSGRAAGPGRAFTGRARAFCGPGFCGPTTGSGRAWIVRASGPPRASTGFGPNDEP
jgi:hypothetical protein